MTAERNLEQRRDEILAAAERCFEARGFAATTMEAVAERAGISKGSIYNYFSSKRDLFTQLFSASMATSEADFDRLASQPISAAEKLSQMVDLWSAMLEHNAHIGGLVLEFWAAAAHRGERNEFSAWFRQTYSEWLTKLRAIIADGVKSGDFRANVEPDVAAALVLAVLDGITVRSILDPKLKLDDEFLESSKAGILNGLTAETPAGEE